ncbi:BTAD domain-containing putative transcriptional regulator [Virgisporangium ochraceum]
MRYYLLGSVRVERDGRHLGIGRSQRRGLLAFLLLNHGRIVTAEALQEALWAGAPPATVRQQVQNAVHAVRTALRQGGTDEVLVNDGHGYVIRAGDDEVDLLEFRRSVSQGRLAAEDGDLPLAAERFQAALRLWRGPALSDASGAFVESARELLEGERVDAIEDHLEVQLRRGLFSDVLATIAAPIEAHPLRERLQAQLIRALHGSGRQSEALEHFRHFRTRLADECGIDPGSALQEVGREILRGSPAAWRSPAAAAPAMLPLDTASFAGRQAELARLDELLLPSFASRATMIAVVAGGGGIGKTALAVHWAHHRRDRFPDGQLHVDLRGYADDRPLRPVEALARLLHALGVPAGDIPTGSDEAAAEYRRLVLDRRMLVLLDNARDADQVRPLLPSGGSCAVIVTSRSRLSGLVAREGAQPLPLEPMSGRESLALLGRVLGQREVTTEPEAAAELGRLCGHVPLALAIAGANLREQNHHSISTFVAQLRGSDRLASLSVPDDEHAAMTRTIDLSYEALPPSGRKTLRRLGLVPGADFTADVVAGLLECDVKTAQLQLELLANYHLVHEHAPHRFRFHDLLRLYAASRADVDDPARTRLAAHYLGHVDAAATVVYPQMARLAPPPRLLAPASFGSAAEATAWLDAELANLVALIEACQTVEDAPVAHLLANNLRGYLHLRMNVVDWQRVADAGLRAAELADDDAARAAAWLSVASLRWRTGDREAAIAGFQDALRLAERAGWVDGQNSALNSLGASYRVDGRLDAAAENHRRGLEMSLAHDLPLVTATHLGNLGIIYSEMGDLPRALSAYREALAIFEKAGSHLGRSYALVNLGDVSFRSGDLPGADGYLARARAAAEELDDKAVLAGTQAVTAHLHLALHRQSRAMECAEQALSLAREIGDRAVEVKALAARAAVMLARGAGEVALLDFEEATQVAHEAGLRLDETIVLIGQARAHLLLGDHRAAAGKAALAAGLAEDHGYRLLAGEAADLLRAAD